MADDFRARVERFRPGGWWRRDTVLQALEIAYPEWLYAGQIHAICRQIRPDWRSPVRRTARALGRLHGLRMADRIGEPPGFNGRDKGTRSGAGFRLRPGYRYRLIIRPEELL